MPEGLRKFARRIAPYVPKPVVIAGRYPRELMFMNGVTSFKSSEPSIAYFTTNKTASKLMSRILKHINRRVIGLTPLNLAGYLWDGSGSSAVFNHLNQHTREYFRDQGILYLPLRQSVDLSHWKHGRILGMLRDPRDQIVSAFKGAFSHRAPLDRNRREAFLHHRAELENMSIDEYVLQYAPSLAARYEALTDCIPRSSLITYELLWEDIDAFFLRLSHILNIQIDTKTLNDIKGMAREYFSTRIDDVEVPWQKGQPGEFRKQLKPEVADQLTDAFSGTLRLLYG